MSNRLYDCLKWIDIIVLPALGTAYAGLAQIWGFPYPEEITGTIMVVCTLLGALLGISSSTYYKGLGEGLYADGFIDEIEVEDGND